MTTARPSVAIVVVTYNRAALLRGCLDSLAALDPAPDAVFVVDNASTDDTPHVLAEYAARMPLRVMTAAENTGGAGGFHRGVAAAYDAGFERLWLMDDDVCPQTDCLAVLLAQPGPCLMAVREDLNGVLCEKSALKFDLRNPLTVRPKVSAVDQRFASRAAMPATVAVENVAFEGFMVDRRVVERIGLPDPRYFIFYDDVDYALRARRAGFPILAVRDAVLVRQLDFNQQHDMKSWKGFYMYRNMFLVHFWYGENLAVRLKPWLFAVAALFLIPLRGGTAETKNVWRAFRAARAMAGQGPQTAAPGSASREKDRGALDSSPARRGAPTQTKGDFR